MLLLSDDVRSGLAAGWQSFGVECAKLRKVAGRKLPALLRGVRFNEFPPEQCNHRHLQITVTGAQLAA
jgi:hypothetical protein